MPAAMVIRCPPDRRNSEGETARERGVGWEWGAVSGMISLHYIILRNDTICHRPPASKKAGSTWPVTVSENQPRYARGPCFSRFKSKR